VKRLDQYDAAEQFTGFLDAVSQLVSKNSLLIAEAANAEQVSFDGTPKETQDARDHLRQLIETSLRNVVAGYLFDSFESRVQPNEFDRILMHSVDVVEERVHALAIFYYAVPEAIAGPVRTEVLALPFDETIAVATTLEDTINKILDAETPLGALIRDHIS